MGRHPRIVVPGVPHHIVHRGNNRKKLFHVVDDYSQYMALLEYYSYKHDIRILSYCLMPNHIHLVVIPNLEMSLSKMIRDIHQRYSSCLNRKMKTSGHNWQNRYFMCPCDESHGIASMCYTELNPVRAGIVTQAWNYEWSSAMAHVGLFTNSNMLDMTWWSERFNPMQWIEILNRYDDDVLFRRIAESTKTGTPLGTLEFIENAENLLGINFNFPKIEHSLELITNVKLERPEFTDYTKTAICS